MTHHTDAFLEAGDVFSALIAAPHRTCRWLHQKDPVHFAKANRTFFISRFADVETALKNPALGRMQNCATPSLGPRSACVTPHDARQRAERLMGGWLLQLNAQDHGAARSFLAPYFRGPWVEALNQRVEACLNSAIARIADDVPFDVIEDVIYPVSFEVTANLLGLKQMPDLSTYRMWNDAIDGLLDARGSAHAREVGLFALSALAARLDDAYDAAEPDPATSLMGAWKSSGGFAHEQALSLMTYLFSIGHTTMANFLGSALHTLASEPETYDRLRADPSRLDRALREILRVAPPGKVLSRTALSDTTIAGHRVRQGQTCQLVVLAANRDPAVFDAPDRFDIDRPAAPNLSFGMGPHACIGMKIAMTTSRTVLSAFLDRASRIELCDPTPHWKSSAILGGLDRLTIRIRQ